MKNKVDRRINKIVKNVNRKLKTDVFKDRFWIRQVKKAKGEDGLQYYLYEMRDRLEPNRNSIIEKGWLWGESFFLYADFYEAINDFIVRSDFWAKYQNNENSYNKEMDYYAGDFYHYHTRNFK